MPLGKKQSTIYKGNGFLWWWRSELIIYLLAVLNFFDHFLNFSWKFDISSNPFSVALFNFEVKMGEILVTILGKYFPCPCPALEQKRNREKRWRTSQGNFPHSCLALYSAEVFTLEYT